MPPSQRHVAYQHIRNQLAAGTVKQGERVSENRFAKDLGMSRIPVREAISQLTSEGLVRQIPGEGVFVPQLSRDEFIELFDLREMLECYAVEHVATAQPTDVVAQLLRANILQMREIARQMQTGLPHLPDQVLIRDWSLTDAQFHLTIVKASNCLKMAKIVADARILTMAISFYRRSVDEPLLTCLARVIKEHWRIYRAIIQQQPFEAVELMRVHIRKSKHTAITASEQGSLWFDEKSSIAGSL